MAIDLRTEAVISFPDAAKVLPAASRPSYATFWRWWRRGVRGVKLETLLIGGKRYTTAEAMQRFVAALSAPDSSRCPLRSTPVRRDRSQISIEAKLRGEGVL